METLALEQQISDKEKELRDRIDSLGIVEDEMDKLKREKAELAVKVADVERRKFELAGSVKMARRNKEKVESELRQMKHEFWIGRHQ